MIKVAGARTNNALFIKSTEGSKAGVIKEMTSGSSFTGSLQLSYTIQRQFWSLDSRGKSTKEEITKIFYIRFDL